MTMIHEMIYKTLVSNRNHNTVNHTYTNQIWKVFATLTSVGLAKGRPNMLEESVDWNYYGFAA